MFKIRSGCFETNSSSSHAMIMLKEDKPLPVSDRIPINSNKIEDLFNQVRVNN